MIVAYRALVFVESRKAQVWLECVTPQPHPSWCHSLQKSYELNNLSSLIVRAQATQKFFPGNPFFCVHCVRSVRQIWSAFSISVFYVCIPLFVGSQAKIHGSFTCPFIENTSTSSVFLRPMQRSSTVWLYDL